MKKVTLNIIGMHCTSCAMNIDGELEESVGVQEACTSYAKQQTEVVYDPEKITPAKMISTIRKIDKAYDAEEIKDDNNRA